MSTTNAVHTVPAQDDLGAAHAAVTLLIDYLAQSVAHLDRASLASPAVRIDFAQKAVREAREELRPRLQAARDALNPQLLDELEAVSGKEQSDHAGAVQLAASVCDFLTKLETDFGGVTAAARHNWLVWTREAVGRFRLGLCRPPDDAMPRSGLDYEFRMAHRRREREQRRTQEHKPRGRAGRKPDPKLPKIKARVCKLHGRGESWKEIAKAIETEFGHPYKVNSLQKLLYSQKKCRAK